MHLSVLGENLCHFYATGPFFGELSAYPAPVPGSDAAVPTSSNGRRLHGGRADSQGEKGVTALCPESDNFEKLLRG